MDANLTDEEKLAEIKKWWGENGGSIITGVLLGLALLFGSKAWFAHQQNRAEAASDNFAVMMSAMDIGNDALVRDKAGVLLTDFPATPYATLAALTLARVNTETGELAAAQSHLQWALDHTDSAILRDVAGLRMARVLLAMGDLGGARSQLDQHEPAAAFDALYTEVRGDIARASGDQAAAGEAYQQALAATEPNSPGYHLLQLKYDSAVAPAPVSASEPAPAPESAPAPEPAPAQEPAAGESE